MVDIDVIDNETKFMQHIRSFGADISIFEDQIRYLVRYVGEQRTVGSAAETKEILDKIFSEIDPKKPLS